MEFFKINQYIEQLDILLRQECTGTALELAQRLGISKRTLQNHLQQLRAIGIVIVYDNSKRTYKYLEKGHLTFGFIVDQMQ
ncbi:MAG: HTH domain-containing protein [Bacteroidales bacterium]|nr:HTH domain-containing protein [Bacteroidales bacterium]